MLINIIFDCFDMIIIEIKNKYLFIHINIVNK